MNIELNVGEEIWVTTPRGTVFLYWTDEDLVVETFFDPNVTVPRINEMIGQEIDSENPGELKRVCRVWLFDKENLDKQEFD